MTSTTLPTEIAEEFTPPQPLLFMDAHSEKKRGEQIEELLPLVQHIAARLAIRLPSHFSRNDLIGSGVLGLMDAVHRFDANRGCSLKTFCSVRIRGAMLDELRRLNWAPRSVHEEAKKLREATEKVSQRLGREPDEEQIREELGLDPRAFEVLLDRVKPIYCVSMQEPANFTDNHESMLYEEVVADSRALDACRELLHKEDKTLLLHQLKMLPPQQLQVLSLYYIEDLRLKEIAEILDITESRVSQIHTLALSRLRSAFERARRR